MFSKKAAPSAYKSLWDIPVKTLNDKSYTSLRQFYETDTTEKQTPKLAIVVNVATKCGLTKGNYSQLVDLHKKYHSQGFDVLAFPCNQFLFQEPGSAEEIQKFACEIQRANFPMFEKVKVNGSDAHEVFQFLKEKAGITRIEWNFGKFLVDSEGQVIEYVGSRTEPQTIEPKIQEFLKDNQTK
eukprot:403355735